MLITPLENSFKSPEEKAAEAQVAEQKKIEQQLKSNKYATALDLVSISQANDIENFLATLEIKDINEIKHDENLDEPDTGIKGYRLANKDYKNIFLYINPNKTVQAVRYNTKNLYKDGTIFAKITDVALTLEQETNMQISVEKTVKKILKAPKTAEFCSFTDYQFSIENGVGSIAGYVDAQNSFGAMIRTYYSAQYNMKTGEMIHFVFNGESIF